MPMQFTECRWGGGGVAARLVGEVEGVLLGAPGLLALLKGGGARLGGIILLLILLLAAPPPAAPPP